MFDPLNVLKFVGLWKKENVRFGRSRKSSELGKSSKTSFLVALYNTQNNAWLILDISFLFSRFRQSLVITDLNTRREIPSFFLSAPTPSLYTSFVNRLRFRTGNKTWKMIPLISKLQIFFSLFLPKTVFIHSGRTKSRFTCCRRIFAISRWSLIAAMWRVVNPSLLATFKISPAFASSFSTALKE